MGRDKIQNFVAAHFIGLLVLGERAFVTYKAKYCSILRSMRACKSLSP